MRFRRETFLFLFSLAVALMVVTFGPTPMLARSRTAMLRGSVRDGSGATVANAKIWLTNNTTSVRREAVTSKSGRFTIANLEPGTYTLRAQSDGFAVVEIRDLVFKSKTRRYVRLQLQAGIMENHATR